VRVFPGRRLFIVLNNVEVFQTANYSGAYGVVFGVVIVVESVGCVGCAGSGGGGSIGVAVRALFSAASTAVVVTVTVTVVVHYIVAVTIDIILFKSFTHINLAHINIRIKQIEFFAITARCMTLQHAFHLVIILDFFTRIFTVISAEIKIATREVKRTVISWG
jgi:hypothetical protein